MSSNLNLEQVNAALGKVGHPMIDKSLVELGIVKQVSLEESKVKVLVAFPFPNIPIAGQLIESIRKPLLAMGAEVEVEQTVMNPEELQRFMTLEQQGWRG